MAIVAGWNKETLCEHPRPSLTSIELNYDRVGYEAARLLGRLMDERESGSKAKKEAEPERILLPPQKLVVRESTDFFNVADEVMTRALRFIADNSHRRIGPDDVAQAVGVERRALQNRFRKHIDRPIAAEIRRVRVERAKRELAESKRTLSEIAHDVGFGNMQRLYEVFRREVGVTPGQYRQQRQLETGE